MPTPSSSMLLIRSGATVHKILITISICLIIIWLPESALGTSSKLFTGSEIKDTISINSAFISGSEQLTLNGTLLITGDDYRPLPKAGLVILKHRKRSDSNTDSLKITFEPVPSWLTKPYGRPLPSIKPATRTDIPQPPRQNVPTKRGSSDLSISGAKSFRLSARTEGASNFGQSLDLKIEGELSPGLNISGTISDRGRSRAYGTVNARLSDLDKLNLKVFSNSFTAELGDLKPEAGFGLNRRQRMTGLGFSVSKPTWHVNAVLSRPRGEYKSIRLNGQDNLQGPYQLSVDGRAVPIVPGSETVWLDGLRLTRGTNKDYRIGYSLGQLTFNVNRPIDSRSRIEIDFEPQATDYKKELYGLSYGLNSNDSAFYITMSALREGDDKNEPLAGDLSPVELALLRNSGDSVVWLMGAVADTTGNYTLIVDSLPDSVYQFVAAGLGDYRVTFTYVGEATGDYQLIGSGHYQFVGRGQGEYLPLRRLVTPGRRALYQTIGGLSNKFTGDLTFDLRQSQFDQNLFSKLHDEDNKGVYVDLQNRKSWTHRNKTESFSFRYRTIEPQFNARTRLHQPEYRRTYLLPENFTSTGREQLLETKLALVPVRWFGFTTSLSQLDYKKQFTADQLRLSSKISFNKIGSLQTAWSETSTSLTATGPSRTGESKGWQLTGELKPATGWKIISGIKTDQRKNSYKAEWQGTRFNQLTSAVYYKNELINWERYREDSLIGCWRKQLTRNRLSITSTRRLGQLNYDLMLTKQWLEQTTNLANSFLGRLNLRYNHAAKRFNLAASYLLSEENKNARGIIYVEVDPGEGEYIFDPEAAGEGQYLPDEAGNFIRLEELLSQKEHVRRGERSFSFNKQAKLFQLRLDSRHIEELLDAGNRNLSWVIPFLADESAPYLFFSGRQNIDFRLFPLAGFHIVNFSLSRQLESRLAAGDNRKRESLSLKLTTKEKYGQLFIEQTLNRFENDRDSYYSGIGLVEGWHGRLRFTRRQGGSKISFALAYRRANSDQAASVKTWLAEIGSSLSLFSKGRLETNIELYRHTLSAGAGSNSYQLTDNRPGEEGAVWSASLRYGLKKGVRSNFTLSGRHADNRSGRLLARGEIIATF